MKKKLIFIPVVFIGLLIILALSSGAGAGIRQIKDLDLSSKTPDRHAGDGVKLDLDFGKIPLYFITNKGQVNKKAKFYAKASRYTLWLTKQGLVFDSVKKVKVEAEVEKTHPAPSGHPSRPRHTPPFGHPSQEGSIQRPHLPYSPHSPHSPKSHRDVSRFVFLNANKDPQMVSLDEAKLRVNYFIGNDRSKWHCDIPTSTAVLYKGLYKNIDLKVYGIEKQVEYDWVVKPGGNPEDIRFEYKNVKGTRIDEKGNLLIETDFGELMHKKPVSYQTGKAMIEGVGAGPRACPSGEKNQTDVNVTFKKLAENTYGFEVGAYDKSCELIIDPVVLAYSTYLGGGGNDNGKRIAVDGSGNAYVTGNTSSIDFPTWNQYQGDQGDVDTFVTKLDTTQSGASSLIYSTYLGGGGNDIGYGIAVDGNGIVYVTGDTDSADFPTRGQYQANQGERDAFVTKLDTTQSGADSLVYSTYLGGDDSDYGKGITVNSSGNAYVTGFTYSVNFPTKRQYQVDIGDWDAFVTKLDTNQSGADSLVYSTYLGGNSTDYGWGIAVDSSGIVYVTGDTDSADFPTRGQYQAAQGGDDAFVTKLDTNQSGADSLVYSTYLGGGSDDFGKGIAIDSSGFVYVTGFTDSVNFPTKRQYQVDIGGWDAFVTKLDTNQSGADSMVYSTYLGGNSTDYGRRITVDSSGIVYVTGHTSSHNFPTKGQYQADQGGDDAFVTKLDTNKSGVGAMVYSTYLGGSNSDYGWGIAVDSSGIVYVSGNTYSSDFPTKGQYQGNQANEDTFITKLIEINLPTITTSAIVNPTQTTAQGGGDVTSNGGAPVTARGVCWSNSPDPTISDPHTSDGTGTGPFTSSITGLTPGTTYHVRAYATNSVGTAYGNDVSFTTTATLPTVTTAAVSNITSTSAASGGNVTANGGSPVTARGVCCSTSTNPTTADNKTSNGSGTGAFTSSITGLTPGTTYHVRAYAINSVGTAYGSDVSFTTGTTLPTVTTAAVSNITSTSAASGGNVTADGGSPVTARGVCWSKSLNPTTADNKTANGSGTGAFTSSITGLTPGTTYHVRAYATNSVGTAYGSDVSFTTGATLPTVTTDTVTNITPISASCGGNVKDNGGAAVTTRGVCWSTSANPTTSNNHTDDGTGTGTFTSSITGLTPETTYHVRAYATNAQGTSYGDEHTFTTPANPKISGKITKTTNTGYLEFPGVTLTFTSYNGGTNTVTTDAGGKYSCTVDYGWVGTVTPANTGYTFNPDHRSYDESVTSDLPNQDYTASKSIITYLIEGRVTTTTDGTGLQGVILTFSGGGGYAITDANGDYSYSVDEGWSGTVTPKKTGYTFNPGNRTYAGVNSNKPGENYEAAPVLPVISGRVYHPGGTGIPGVILNYMVEGEPKSIETDFNGNYQFEVPHGWWGEVTPTKEGYKFDPPGRDYENLTVDQPDQDYEAQLEYPSPVISGMVANKEGIGIPGVTLSFSENGGETFTDANGNYSHAVDYGWSGNLTPGKAGYEFEPSLRMYTEVQTDQQNQDYTATAIFPVISGLVKTPGDMPIPGAALDFTDSPAFIDPPGTTRTYTNKTGNYTHAVPFGWTGIVMPSKHGFEFQRAAGTLVNYEHVYDNIPGQDYTAIPMFLFISGKVTTPDGQGLEDVVLTAANGDDSAFTDENGNYFLAVDYGWSGTVTPFKKGYVFDPTHRTYDPVKTDIPGEDYQAIAMVLISGRVSQATGSGISGVPDVTLVFSGGVEDAITNNEGYYEGNVDRGWSGTVTPQKPGYVFYPPCHEYVNSVNFDRPNQNFMAISSNLTIKLEATRIPGGSMLVRMDYGEISLTVERTGDTSVALYVIYRKDNGGQYNPNHVIPGFELPGVGTKTYQDMYLDPGKTYTYKAEALDSAGRVICVSNEKEI